MTYKEIFQLAYNKQYNKWHFFPYYLIESGNANEDNCFIELSFIQKWLRDEHRILVNVSFDSYVPDAPAYYAEIHSLSSKNMGEELLSGFLYHKDYDKALAEGIHEALKLLP